MTACPGCHEQTETVGGLGLWADGAGCLRKAYLLCPRCASILQRGGEAECSRLVERIEFFLEYPYEGGNG